VRGAAWRYTGPKSGQKRSIGDSFFPPLALDRARSELPDPATEPGRGDV